RPSWCSRLSAPAQASSSIRMTAQEAHRLPLAAQPVVAFPAAAAAHRAAARLREVLHQAEPRAAALLRVVLLRVVLLRAVTRGRAAAGAMRTSSTFPMARPSSSFGRS